MRVLVCGSRTWTDVQRIYDRLALLPADTTIVVGYDPEKKYPPGADEIAYHVALHCGLEVECYPFRYELGRRGGFVRNLEMFDYPVPELVIAFWNGKSPGTKSSLSIARRREVPAEVHRSDPWSTATANAASK